jgi:Methyltransferase domain
MSGDELRALAAAAPSRAELWGRFLAATGPRQAGEIGIFRGEFTAAMLAACGTIERYWMIDPWRHLGDWNKPANTSDELFERIRAEALARTAAWEEKRVVLQGTTTEVIDRVPDASLDFLYVDGDHTLRGIAIDLIAAHRKVRDGGWIGGDDFSASIWQHEARFEPTLVFPFAVHFAEAAGDRIYALPHDQFLIEKLAGREFELVDLTGRYGDLGLNRQLRARPPQRALARELRRRLRHGVGRARRLGARR